MNRDINIYHKSAQNFAETYDSVTFEDVHSDWIHLLPKTGNVLDIGAGSGRDSRYLACRGLHVTAVEPADNLRAIAKQNSQEYKINWISDVLPELKDVFNLQTKFDLILVSAVWMHLADNAQHESLHVLNQLMKETATLVITVRYGEFEDGRRQLNVDKNVLFRIASTIGLALVVNKRNTDKLNRTKVYWETYVFKK